MEGNELNLLLRDPHGRFYPCKISWTEGTGLLTFTSEGVSHSDYKNFRFTNHNYKNNMVYYDTGINAKDMLEAIGKKINPYVIRVNDVSGAVHNSTSITISSNTDGSIVWVDDYGR